MMRKNYIPGTETTLRRPTPTEFAHLRGWIASLERFIDIKNITELRNINSQLNQNAKLFINNIIQRTISHGVASYGDGFVSLEGTAGGALKVAAMGSGRTVLNKAITFATAATHEIIAAVTGKKIKICNLMLTIAGDTNLTFKSATTAISGALDFGGTDEPRGMIHNFGDFPLETAAGEAFNITSSGAVQVSGYATYFTE